MGMSKEAFFKSMKEKFGDWNKVDEREFVKVDYKRPEKVYMSIYDYLEVNPGLLNQLKSLNMVLWASDFHKTEEADFKKEYYDKYKSTPNDDLISMEEKKYIHRRSVDEWISNFHEASARKYLTLKKNRKGQRVLVLKGKESTLNGDREKEEELVISLEEFKKHEMSKFLLKESNL